MAKKPEDYKQDDQILEKYLEGDTELSRAYATEGKVQVPTHLDKAVLLAANEAVRPKQHSMIAYSPFARSWYVPASMAAVLMLCIGLVFTIYKDSGQALLTAPKSEFDTDAQIVPVETPKSIGQGRLDTAAEKNRKYKFKDDAIPMDVIQEANKPVPSSIEVYELEEAVPEKSPASTILLREKVMKMDNDAQSDLTDKATLKKDTSEQSFSDAPYNIERQNNLGRIEAADVKKQKQMDAGALNNRLGEMELKANEEEVGTGASSAPELRYRQAKESFAEGKRTAEEDSLEDITVDGLVTPARSPGDEMMSAEQWLIHINDLWLSGDHQAAKEGLEQFFVAYPDYPKEKIKIILDPDSGLIDYSR